MNDLFKKLNVLVKSSINELLGDDFAVGAPRRRPLDPAKLGKDIDREVEALRQRINEAVEFEDGLQARVVSLTEEVARWDKQADTALEAGRDADARYAVEQMQRSQQRLAMAESDLHEHQLVTQELIQRVNALESAVADVRRSQAENAAADEPETVMGQGDEDATQPSRRILSDVLRDAREKIARMGDLIAAKDEVTAEPESTEDPQAIDDDLSERRQRLSKPK